MILDLGRDYPSRHGLPIVNKIDTLVFTILYPRRGCSAACRDVCCSGGATMDRHTFERLLEHKDAPAFRGIDWEGYPFEPDIYSPGGAGCYTRFDGGRCMFNGDDWGCSIHTYCLEHGIDHRELKFFTCCLFPVEVNKIGTVQNILTAGFEMRHDQYDLPCKRNGDTPVFDIARDDVAYYYGEELILEIEKRREAWAGRSL